MGAGTGFNQSLSSMIGGFVGGSGTVNYLSKWTPDGVTIGNSQIFDNGTRVGVGTALPEKFFSVSGEMSLGNGVNSSIFLNNSGSGKVLLLSTTSAGFNSISVVLGATGGLSELNTAGSAWSMNKDLRLDSSSTSNIYVNNGGNGLLLSGRNDTSGNYGIKINNDGYAIFQANNAAIADGSMSNSKLCFYINEAGNTLTVKVKYAAGTVKIGTVVLV
jgi:hypothetical protein